MIEQPLVSIIVPCYNAGEYITEAIYSACDQSYADTEIIVVDDGSTDESVAKAAKALATCACKREYTILKLGDNTGACNAVNVGFGAACGKYAMMLAADDVLVNDDYIKDAVKTLESTGADWCYASIFLEGKDVNTSKVVFSKWFVHTYFDNIFLMFPPLCELLLHVRNPVNSGTLMIRMDTFRKKQLSWSCQGNRAVCDGALLSDMMYKGLYGVSLPVLGTLYRTHLEQITNTREFQDAHDKFGRV